MVLFPYHVPKTGHLRKEPPRTGQMKDVFCERISRIPLSRNTKEPGLARYGPQPALTC